MKTSLISLLLYAPDPNDQERWGLLSESECLGKTTWLGSGLTLQCLTKIAVFSM